MYTKPITDASFSWAASKAMPIEESGEPLVPISYCPERILARPEYFFQGLSSALPEMYLRKGVYERLVDAAKRLPEGYRFVVFDGWRPLSLQSELFEQYKKELAVSHPELDNAALSELTTRFVALPDANSASPSPHNTGGAVDLSIADANGWLLYMGAEFDETTERSKTTYFEKRVAVVEAPDGQEQLARDNRRLLFHAMNAAGFTNYPDEWWHFDYGNQNWALMSASKKAIYGGTCLPTRWMKRD